MKNTRFKKISSLVLILALALTPLLGVVPASANDETIPVSSEITKYLQMPAGTNTPVGAAFTFEFAVQSGRFDYDRAPAIANQTVTFDGTEAEIDAATRARLGVAADVRVVSRTVDFFGNFLAIENLRPGHFVYHVTETEGTNNNLPPLPNHVEEFGYDRTTFELHIIVSEVNGVLEANMFAWDLGTEWNGDLTSIVGKVDYMSFLNTFLRRTQEINCPPGDPDCPPGGGGEIPVIPNPPGLPGDPEWPVLLDNALTVMKRVSGDQSYTGDVFNFTVNITPHSLETRTAFTAFIYNFNADHGANGAWVRDDASRVSFAAGANSFTLRHDQMLVFEPVLIGTGFDVTEAATAGYTATITLILGATSRR